jgi:hypothetical protein
MPEAHVKPCYMAGTSLEPVRLIRGQSTGLDNQQRRIEERLHWLGGIIDGEGMVTVIKRSELKKKDASWSPRISVVNTDIRLINEVIAIYEEINIPHYVQSKKDKKNPHWRIKYEILINGLKRCNQAIPTLIDYVVVKKNKMIAMREWIDYRLGLSNRHPYTDKDFVYLNLIRETSIPPRDYTQGSPVKGDDDIVRPYAKALGV